MKFRYSYHTEKMSMSASAPCTNAYSFCAHSADTAVISALDAIIMASIIICVLLGLLLCAVIDLVLVAVVSIIWQMNTPMVRARAS